MLRGLFNDEWQNFLITNNHNVRFFSVKNFSVQRAVDECSPMLIRLQSTCIVFQLDNISRTVSEEKRKVADRFCNPS